MAEKKPHIMIVESRFYDDIAFELVSGATEVIEAAGGTYEKFDVAGAFEIPAAISYAILQQELKDTHLFDGYIALGCVIRGETSHYDHICQESARGLMDLAIQHGLSLANGILTVENRDQAWARAGLKMKNKGAEVAHACLGMIETKNIFGLFPR